MILFKIGIVFLVCILLFHFSTKKYLNPYKLIMVFGKKGCGKTTFLTKLAFQHLKRGWAVYSTEPIPGTYHVPAEDVGSFRIPAHSVLLVDEAGMVWDNRDFKKFSTAVRDWFKYQRHEEVKVYLFSQTFDIDKKLRDLTDAMYLLENRARVFSYGRRINKAFVLNNSTAEAPSNIAENLKFDSFLWFWCGSRILTFIPKYSVYFDSHSKLPLPDKEWPKMPIKERRSVSCGIKNYIVNFVDFFRSLWHRH